MAFRQIATDSEGVLYAIQDNGDLLFYQYLDPAQDGSGNWTNGGVGQKIASGWDGYLRVVCGGDGILYAVSPNGDLYFYQDLARNGTPDWAHDGVGQKIGTEFQGFLRLAADDKGVIYAVTPDGHLLFYQDLARDGRDQWAHDGAGQLIGSGFEFYRQFVCGGNGTLYCVAPNGDLNFYQDLARDGTVHWANAGVAQKIGGGWNVFNHVSSGGDGMLYAASPDGFLLWYRDLARNGTQAWVNGGVGQTIGSGFIVDQVHSMALEGYSVPFTAAPGDRIEFKVSAQSPYTVTYYRLGQRPDGPVKERVGNPLSMPASVKAVPPKAWESGYGWSTDFSVTVGAEWRSGLYAAECTSLPFPDLKFPIVLVVKPSTGANSDFAVLANTHTWTAYNDAGGRSQYSVPNAAILSFERPNRMDDQVAASLHHLARGELWVLTWLESQGFQFHLFSDLDFHRGVAGLSNYKGVIVHTHPEYWTNQMRDNLDQYLAGGGNLIYLGGNGLFELISLDEAQGRMVLRKGNADNPRDLFRDPVNNRSERAVLGVAFEVTNWMTFAGYTVLDATHPFFQGTGLQNGAVFGEGGLNGGGASGWEMDSSISAGSDAGEPPFGIQILARGRNVVSGTAYGADMTYYETAAGGFVFSVGSLSFGGSLVQDPNLQIIVTNALTACLMA